MRNKDGLAAARAMLVKQFGGDVIRAPESV